MSKPRSDAAISADGLYRYSLTRWWNEDAPTMAFILCNPSTADASSDDPTVRKGIGFAKHHGCGKLIFVNLWAFRSTDPWGVKNQVGPENDSFIAAALSSRIVVAAWGRVASKLPGFKERREVVCGMLHRVRGQDGVRCLGLTKDHEPRHPLMLAYQTPLVSYDAGAHVRQALEPR